MTPDPEAPRPSGTLSLEGRPAPALYFLGWLLPAVGFGLLLVAIQMAPGVATLFLLLGVAVIGVGFGAAAGYQIVARSRRPPGRFRGASPALLLGIQICLTAVLSLPLAAVGLGTETPMEFALVSAVLFLAYVLIVWLFGFRASAITWRDLGFAEWPGARRLLGDIGTGFVAAALLWPITTTLLVVLSLLLDSTTPQIVPPPESALDIALLTLGAAVLVPIGEELMFRGYSVTAWLKDLGPRSALIRSTLFFAIAHVLNIQAATFDAGIRQVTLTVVVIVPVGLVLGWLFLRRGIVASVGGHFMFNLIAVVLLTLSQLAPTVPAS